MGTEELLKEEIDYQQNLIREISKIDIFRAFDTALKKIDSLEKMVYRERHMFESAIEEITIKGSKISQIEKLCKDSIIRTNGYVKSSEILLIIRNQ